MEPLGILGVAGAVTRVSSKVWALSESWIDAPRDFHRLKDELARTRIFFDEAQQGVLAVLPASEKGTRTPAESNLAQLLDAGTNILESLEQIIDTLRGTKGLNDDGELRKRRRLSWMANAERMGRLRSELNDMVSGLCRLLIVRNV
jgi:hypothetical protein